MSELNRMTGDFSPEERATLLAQFEQSGLDFRRCGVHAFLTGLRLV
jgi:hypothetical protein